LKPLTIQKKLTQTACQKEEGTLGKGEELKEDWTMWGFKGEKSIGGQMGCFEPPKCHDRWRVRKGKLKREKLFAGEG